VVQLNKDRAFSHLYIQCDGRAGYEQYEGEISIMDNAPIHTPLKVYERVESREYKCFYLLAYCPFYNPIEKSWSKVKATVRRNTLTADNRLSDRICESVQVVTRFDCQAWIRPAVSFFPRCKRKDINL
jgi:transposase